MSGAISLRTELRPGDIGAVVRMHGLLYARERGWDHRFEACVARPLAEFALSHDAGRERIWLAQSAGHVAGSIAIVNGGGDDAQLRWFLVAPELRRAGAGTRLITEALDFCRATSRPRVFLWTVRGLDDAARLYARAGFRLTEARASERWGTPVVEERWDLELTS